MSTCEGCGVEIPQRRGRGRSRKWCTDKCRKVTLYAGTCIDCGRQTNGYNGPGTASDHCMDCIRWPDEAILDAIRRWAETHGGIPPTCTDWRHAGEDHPVGDVVIRRMGWNEALLAAGCRLHTDRRPKTWQRILRELQAGRLVSEIAADLGVTDNNIHRRAAYRGTTVQAIREAAGIKIHRAVPWEWVVEQMQAGRSLVDVAAEAGVQPHAIRQRAYKRGLSMRELRGVAA